MKKKEEKKLSKYISEIEYICRHCKAYPPDFTLIPGSPYSMLFDIFDSLREKWGKPILISSGYRCQAHNAKIGGAPLSIHLFGLALDLMFKNIEERIKFQALVEKEYPELRRGTYKDRPHILHIDVGYLIYPRATDKWTQGVEWIT
ncbi:MAG: D-Ala-D-Ala carboxypeptidase family metallohydrolase [Candidatus Omnitrophica bacterium]|nr:D-Ala-D-Ala carboxypeptidase family metallohydrolase [Candidatus Omnitrophota bacterium]